MQANHTSKDLLQLIRLEWPPHEGVAIPSQVLSIIVQDMRLRPFFLASTFLTHLIKSFTSTNLVGLPSPNATAIMQAIRQMKKCFLPQIQRVCMNQWTFGPGGVVSY